MSRVDIAGFSAPNGTSIKLGEKSFGAVKEQLDMKGTEQTILENLKKVLKHMSSLPTPKDDTKSTAQRKDPKRDEQRIPVLGEGA